MSASLIIVCCAGRHSYSVHRPSTLRQREGPGVCLTLTRFTTICWHQRYATSSRTLTSMATLLHCCTTPPSLDQQVPVRHVTCRRRPSYVWLDDECRTAKRAVRWLERVVPRAKPHSAADPSTVAAWRAQRRQYVELVRRKRSAFWTSRVDAEQPQPRRLQCGERLMSCLAAAPRLRRLTLSRQRCTNFSMRRSPASVPQPPVQIHQHSRLHLSAACCGCLRQLRQKTET